MKKFLKRISFFLMVLSICAVVSGLCVGNYFYRLALDAASDKSEVLQANHNSIKNIDENILEVFSKREEWFLQTEHRDVYLESYDGLKLHATEISNQSDNWAIVCHGYDGEGVQMMYSAQKFFRMGYNVLLPDARGQGESEGAYIGMGWHERLDVVGWINQIVAQHADAQIILYGVSMGGATVMMASGEPLPANVKAVVEDCGYSSVWDEFSYQLDQLYQMPDFPMLHFATAVTKLRAGYSFGEASAIDQVAKSKTPTLFIHGGSDTFVPSYMVYEVYEACSAPKQLFVVEGAGHAMSASVAGTEYWKKISDFVSLYVTGSV